MTLSSDGLRDRLLISLLVGGGASLPANCGGWVAASTHMPTVWAFLNTFLLSVFSKRHTVPLPPEQIKPLE